MASTDDINAKQKKYIPVPFANGADLAYVNNIPQTRASGDPKNKATWNAGFPPITMQPVNVDGTGGIPPSGADMNGVLNTLSSHAYFAQYGVSYDWDSNIASNLGGYPSGAIVAYPAGNNANKTLYLSLQDNNTSTPTSNAWKVLIPTTPPVDVFSWLIPDYANIQWLIYASNKQNERYTTPNQYGWIYAATYTSIWDTSSIYINGAEFRIGSGYNDEGTGTGSYGLFPIAPNTKIDVYNIGYLGFIPVRG